MTNSLYLWEDQKGQLYWEREGGEFIALPLNIPKGQGLQDALDILSDNPKGDWVWESRDKNDFLKNPKIDHVLVVKQYEGIGDAHIRWLATNHPPFKLKGKAAKEYMLGELK